MGRRRTRHSVDPRPLRRWLRVTGAAYAVGTLSFAMRPQDAPWVLGRLGGTRLEPENAGVYNALASAYMATIAVLALTAADDEGGRAYLIPPLLVAKAASSLALINRYRATRARGFAAGAVLDASILGVTVALYRASAR